MKSLKYTITDVFIHTTYEICVTTCFFLFCRPQKINWIIQKTIKKEKKKAKTALRRF